MIIVDLCLSDIPKEMIKRANNGKAYCKIVVAERRSVDKFGNNLTVFMSMPKEDKGKDKIYIGTGKSLQKKIDIPSQELQANNFSSIKSADDLPY